MYAYKQKNEERRLRVVSNSIDTYSFKTKASKKKKKNLLQYYFRLIAVVLMACAYIYTVFPIAYQRLIKNVFYPYKISFDVSQNKFLAEKIFTPPKAVDLYKLMYPTINYLSNDMFNNMLLQTPTKIKTHSEISTMFLTKEMTNLKNQLFSLMKEYPMISPAIYVWEYDKGEYVDINGEEIYSAASIIKIPVLIRLFKSIEAKQMTIFDEMILTDYYKSSGSGGLQYAQTGRKFSLDELAKTMIQDSDNSATNMLMAKMGGMDDINVGLRDWGISKTYVRTWLPDLNGTNKTTAKDMAKLLYNLDNPGFLNINSREYIIDYMSHVKNNRLIAAGLGEGALFIHKTGDIGTMLGDAGIVYAQNGKKYIVVILVNRPHNAPQGKDFIVKASSLIYKSIVE